MYDSTIRACAFVCAYAGSLSSNHTAGISSYCNTIRVTARLKRLQRAWTSNPQHTTPSHTIDDLIDRPLHTKPNRSPHANAPSEASRRLPSVPSPPPPPPARRRRQPVRCLPAPSRPDGRHHHSAAAAGNEDGDDYGRVQRAEALAQRPALPDRARLRHPPAGAW